MGSNVRINQVRQLLRAAPDGMTAEQVSEVSGIEISHTRRILKCNLPDAYIDRWERSDSKNYSAVWCIVIPPENCPRPEPKRKTKK